MKRELEDQDPKSWIPPVWHSDWLDPADELNALRGLAVALKAHDSRFQVELDVFEQGYMCMLVGWEHGLVIGEVHVVTSDDYIFGIFLTDDADEKHVNRVSEGVEYFAKVVDID
ncbi:MAG: hypothetical protein AAF351_09105 [Pseudomonadota bacterium]